MPPEVAWPPLDWTGLFAGACRLLEEFEEFEGLELDDFELDDFELDEPVDPELVEPVERVLAWDVPLPADFEPCDVRLAEDLAE